MVVSRVFICSGVWFWLISVIVVVSHLCAGVRLGGCLFFDFYFVYVLMNGAAICRELCSDVWSLMLCVDFDDLCAASICKRHVGIVFGVFHVIMKMVVFSGDVSPIVRANLLLYVFLYFILSVLPSVHFLIVIVLVEALFSYPKQNYSFLCVDERWWHLQGALF